MRLVYVPNYPSATDTYCLVFNALLYETRKALCFAWWMADLQTWRTFRRAILLDNAAKNKFQTAGSNPNPIYL